MKFLKSPLSLRLPLLLSFFLSLSVSVYADPEDFDGGTGVEGDPYLISDCTSLAALDDSPANLAAHYELTASIACTVQNFPLAREMDGGDLDAEFAGFSGTFNGAGFMISYSKNIPVEVDQDNYLGLFGYVNGGTIKNLTVEAGHLQGPGATNLLQGLDYVGGLVGFAEDATFINVHGGNYSIEADSNTGGLIGGMNGSTLLGSSFSGDIVNNGGPVGGLVGRINVDPEGGVAISRSYVDGNISGFGNIGGLVGYLLSATIEDSYSIAVLDGAAGTGGLVGTTLDGAIRTSYAAGTVENNIFDDAGGLVGTVWTATTIEDSFSAALMVSADRGLGGIIGGFQDDNDALLTITNTYWDTDASGIAGALNCSALGDTAFAGCIPVDPNGDPNYWVTDENDPLGVWDTNEVWNFEVEGNYPELYEYVENVAELDPVYYVAPVDAGDGDCSSAENACDLHHGLDLAENDTGDIELIFAAGTYEDDGYAFDGGVEGAALILTGNGSDDTFITDEFQEGLIIEPVGDVTITGINFKDGVDSGLHVPGSTSAEAYTLTIDDCIFEGNAEGGLVVETNDDITVNVTNSTLIQNTSSGIGAGARVELTGDNAAITFEENIISGNFTDQEGGGAYLRASGDNSTISFIDNTLTGNDGLWGGGVVIDTDGAAGDNSVTFTGNTIGGLEEGAGNSADQIGAGAKIFARDGLVLEDNSFYGNISGGNGGGLHVTIDGEDGNISTNSISENTIGSNTSAGNGGGMFLTVSCNCTLTVEANYIYGNEANDAEGGGGHIAIFDAEEAIKVRNNIIVENNSTQEGGGLDFYFEGGGLDFINNTVANNNLIGGNGGGILVGVNAEIEAYVANNIFWGNTSGGGDGIDVMIDLDAGGYVANHNIFNELCSSDLIVGTFCNAFLDDIVENNLVAQDPEFVGEEEEFYLEYTFSDESPAINAGDNEAQNIPEADFLGGDRIKEETVDLGAFESEFETPGSGGRRVSFSSSGGSSSGGGSSPLAESVVNTIIEEIEVIPPVEEVVEFTDIDGHWAKTYIETLAAECGVLGYADKDGKLLNIFDPNNEITRAEFVKMLIGCQYQAIPSQDDNPFSDLDAADWYTQTILYAHKLGWIDGYSDGTFGPNKKLSRAEAIKIIIRSEYKEEEITSNNNPFADVPAGEWYAKYVNFAADKKIVGGYENEDGKKVFLPANNITRAESAKVIVDVQ